MVTVSDLVRRTKSCLNNIGSTNKFVLENKKHMSFFKKNVNSLDFGGILIYMK